MGGQFGPGPFLRSPARLRRRATQLPLHPQLCGSWLGGGGDTLQRCAVCGQGFVPGVDAGEARLGEGGRGIQKRSTCLAKTAMSSLKESEEQTSPPATPGSRGVQVASSHFSKTRASRGNNGCLPGSDTQREKGGGSGEKERRQRKKIRFNKYFFPSFKETPENTQAPTFTRAFHASALP